MHITAMERAVIEGLRANNTINIVKHIPNHGQTMANNHVELPIVTTDTDTLETDLAPFIALNDTPMTMTAHIVYPT